MTTTTSRKADAMTPHDEPRTFNPAGGRPHIAALLARPEEERLLMVLAYLAEPKHRAEVAG